MRNQNQGINETKNLMKLCLQTEGLKSDSNAISPPLYTSSRSKNILEFC